MAAPPAANKAPSALLITLGCKETFHLAHGLLKGEHYGIISWSHRLLARRDNNLAFA